MVPGEMPQMFDYLGISVLTKDKLLLEEQNESKDDFDKTRLAPEGHLSIRTPASEPQLADEQK